MAHVDYALSRIMEEKGLSQADVARAASIPVSTFSRYVHGADMPASTAKRIARALGVTVDELLGFDVRLTSEELELVHHCRAMPADLRALLLTNARVYSSRKG